MPTVRFSTRLPPPGPRLFWRRCATRRELRLGGEGLPARRLTQRRPARSSRTGRAYENTRRALGWSSSGRVGYKTCVRQLLLAVILAGAMNGLVTLGNGFRLACGSALAVYCQLSQTPDWLD